MYKVSFEQCKRGDIFKQSLSKACGITLLIIPFWWNKSIHSFAHELYANRPDIEVPPSLLKEGGIPQEMPNQLEAKGRYIAILHNIIVNYVPKESHFVEVHRPLFVGMQ